MDHLSSASVHLTSFSPKAAASPRPGGKPPHCPRARPEGHGLRSPVRSGDPSPGAGIHVTRTPNPRASVSSGTSRPSPTWPRAWPGTWTGCRWTRSTTTGREEWRRQLPESLGEGLRQGLSRLGISLLGKGPGRGRGRRAPASGPTAAGYPRPDRAGGGWPFRLPAEEAEAETGPQPGPHA